MLLIKDLFEKLKEEAKRTSKLRANYCLHESQEDNIQKMINVILPDSEVPIHRHLYSDETLVVLRGRIEIVMYDENGIEKERNELSHQDNQIIDIKKGLWHSIAVTEPVCLLEIKEGPYRPLVSQELLNV